MRQMPAGQWVAFENNAVHDCEKPSTQKRREGRPPKRESKAVDQEFEEINIPVQVRQNTPQSNTPPPQTDSGERLSDESAITSASRNPSRSPEIQRVQKGSLGSSLFPWVWLFIALGVARIFISIGAPHHH
jgi:hypothetical protein